jgi:hypothetical protein
MGYRHGPSKVRGGSGDATPADLLIGKTASTDLGDIVGTMPNLSGNWQISQFKGVYEGGILAQIPKGYSDGDLNTYTLCYDPDGGFSPANIKEGIRMFGIAGVLAEGKKFASGTITSDQYSNITVRGLTFRPRIIFWHVVNTQFGFSIERDGVVSTCRYLNGSVSSSGTSFYDDGFYSGVNISNRAGIYWEAVG